jgi:hypothetical protein
MMLSTVLAGIGKLEEFCKNWKRNRKITVAVRTCVAFREETFKPWMKVENKRS